MTIWHALLLGAAQGITEFLPVSSSGHLVLLQKLFGIDEPALLFDTAVHAGTLIAVLAALRNEVFTILKKPFQKLTLLLIIATLPAVIAALLWKDAIEALFQSGALLGPAFLFTALALVAAELLAARKTEKKPLSELTVPGALITGLCQSLALLPAVSRSGLTLTGALSAGLKREDAARFSFLLSIPVILGAIVLQAADLKEAALVWDGAQGAAIIAGTIMAFITGLLSVTFMLNIVKKRRLFGFASYTAALGIFCLIWM